MAAKKSPKSKKVLGKKTMKKTKGGILIGLNQPALFVKIESPQVGLLQKGGETFHKFPL